MTELPLALHWLPNLVEGPVNYNIFHGEESPPKIIETKTEDQHDISGAASSAPHVKRKPKKEEARGAAASSEGAPVVEPTYQDIEVDYDPEGEQGEQQELTEAPQEGAASGAPEEEGGPFQPVRRRGARGSKGGLFIKQKAFVKQFHAEGYPALLE